MMFANIKDLTEFKVICINDNIAFHIYTVISEITLTIVLKGLIRLQPTRICENIRCQGLNPIHCAEISTDTKYLIYSVAFAPGTTFAQVNHVRLIENVKIYQENYEFHKPTIQCFHVARCTVIRRQTATRNQRVSNAPDNMTPDLAIKSQKFHQLERRSRGKLFPITSLSDKKTASKEKPHYVQNSFPNMHFPLSLSHLVLSKISTISPLTQANHKTKEYHT